MIKNLILEFDVWKLKFVWYLVLDIWNLLYTQTREPVAQLDRARDF